MGKHAIDTSITIDAPPSRVWEVLSNVKEYSKWNPFLTAIDGELAQGEYVKVTFSNGFKISPMLVAVDKDKELRWKGKLLCGGLFDGEHYFRLVSEEDGRKTRFEQGENFSGILIGVTGSLLKETKLNFIKMNEAIKKRSESPSE
jgi:hypothetical protein